MNASNKKNTFREEIRGTAREVINQIKHLIKEGNTRRLLIENQDGKVLFQSQLTLGVAGTAAITAIAPIVAAIGFFAMMWNKVRIIVERYPADEAEQAEETEADYEIIDEK